MPKKSQRAIKEKKKDFQKQKLKVGKKKPEAASHTSINFKSRSIVLPTQALDQVKKDETNSKNQTLTDICIQLGHTSWQSRRDAIAGLRELILMHPSCLVSRFHTILEKTLRLILDNNGVVRKSLLKFYSEIFKNITCASMRPFTQMLLIYTSSAMSHIDEAIRLDSLQLLFLLTENYNDLILAADTSRLLSNLLTMLSGKLSENIGSSNILVGPDSQFAFGETRSKLLDAVSSLVQNAKGTVKANKEHDCVVAGDVEALAGYIQNDMLVYPGTLMCPEIAGETLSVFSGIEASAVSNTGTDHSVFKLSNSKDLYAFIQHIHPILIQIVMECGGVTSLHLTVASQSAKSAIKSTVKLFALLYDMLFTRCTDELDPKFVAQALKDLEKHFMTGFPIQSMNSKMDEDLNEINIFIAELFASFVAHSSKVDGQLPSFAVALYNHTLQLLRSPSLLSPALTIQLHPIIQTILSNFPKLEKTELFVAYVKFHLNARANSAIRKSTFVMIANVVDQMLSLNRPFRQDSISLSDDPVSECIEAWILSLPRFLWELKNDSCDLTEKVLRILQLFLIAEENQMGRQLKPRPPQFYLQLETSLIPLFNNVISKEGRTIESIGPFSGMPNHLKMRVLHLFYYFPGTRSAKLQEAIQRSTQ